ncbi:MAG: hypothetical protein AB7S81_07080 [Bdellovibrionales bacterium]
MGTGAYRKITHVPETQLQGSRYDQYFVRKGSNIIAQRNELATGWKTYISVDPANMKQAKDIILDVCQKHKVSLLKASYPESPSDQTRSNGTAYKSFTLYDHGETNWPIIIQEIEDRFHLNNIKPGPAIQEGAPILGSQGFCFRRNDKGPNGEYISAYLAAMTNSKNPTNPYNRLDPLQGFFVRSPRALTMKSFLTHGVHTKIVFADLQRTLGGNVKEVTGVADKGGNLWYAVTVPDNFSRSHFTKLGIANPSELTRKKATATHQKVFVPVEYLPSNTQRDACFFFHMQRMFPSINSGYTMQQNGRMEGYVVTVPRTFSRQKLTEFLGEDAELRRRKAKNKEESEIFIPVQYAERAGLTSPKYKLPSFTPEGAPIPQHRQKQQHARYSL